MEDTNNTLTIQYDDNYIDIINNINKILARYNLEFIWTEEVNDVNSDCDVIFN